MGAFLTPNEADDFWVLRNDRASEQNASLLQKNTALSKSQATAAERRGKEVQVF